MLTSFLAMFAAGKKSIIWIAVGLGVLTVCVFGLVTYKTFKDTQKQAIEQAQKAATLKIEAEVLLRQHNQMIEQMNILNSKSLSHQTEWNNFSETTANIPETLNAPDSKNTDVLDSLNRANADADRMLSRATGYTAGKTGRRAD